jgi:hypothetical protein
MMLRPAPLNFIKVRPNGICIMRTCTWVRVLVQQGTPGEEWGNTKEVLCLVPDSSGARFEQRRNGYNCQRKGVGTSSFPTPSRSLTLFVFPRLGVLHVDSSSQNLESGAYRTSTVCQKKNSHSITFPFVGCVHQGEGVQVATRHQ